MTESQILDLFTQVLRDLLADDKISLTMETKRSDIPDWDSLAYVSFIAIIESDLSTKFRLADIESFDSVGAIVRKAKQQIG
jgi:acyl carrier protein